MLHIGRLYLFCIIFAPVFTPSCPDVPNPIRVANEIIPRAPSPLLFYTALSEFGDGGHTTSTVGTPTSTITELGHRATSPSITPGTGPISIVPDIADSSPPARPPSPGFPQTVSPVTLTAYYSSPQNSFMAMGIKCWSCDAYNSITVPASLNHTEVCPLFPFVSPTVIQPNI